MTDGFSKIKAFVKEKWIPIAAAVGALLLLISFFGADGERNAADNTVYTSEDYIRDSESKLSEIVAGITGSKSVRIMITLESSVENIYADATKTNTALAEDGTKGESKTEQSENREKEYMIVKDADGKEQALTVAQVMPQIRGVVIVCSTGSDPTVAEAVRAAAATVLNISTKRVYVAEIQK